MTADLSVLSQAINRIADWRTSGAADRCQGTAAAREQARAINHVLNAFVEFAPAGASLPDKAPLAGLPYAVKDMFRTTAHRPGCGLARTAAVEVAGTCALIGRLQAAGADLVGFTNMTELAYEPSGFNAALGWVKNPWNFDYMPGGSSSGSAAAVAAGAVAVALGSDTGGSLRIPAHACGVTAWKPTDGLISTEGTMPLAPTLDSVGLLARSVRDMMHLVPLMADLPPSLPMRRVAVLSDVVAECDPSIRRLMVDAVSVLAAGGFLIEQRPALSAIETIDRHALIVMQGESARVHRARLADPGLAPMLCRRLSKGLEISDTELAESVAARTRLARDFEEQVLRENDLAVLPVMAVLTPSRSECDPASDRFSARTLYALSRFTRFVNMLGFPAVALPIGFAPRGMPVAMQLVGRAGSDLALLDLVRQVQSMTDWHARVPTAVAGLLEV
jgi:aspartyl-tRNA(Asn)/glutamyl-tRNA(Gln) amidotransferase subunit A